MDSQQLRELQTWVEQFSNASEALRRQLIAIIVAMYAGKNLYSTAAVAATAQEAAAASNSNTTIAAGLAAEYATTTTALMAGESLPTPRLVLAPIRNGADMTKVYARPAKLFRRLKSEGVPTQEAFTRAMQLASSITDMNVTLAQREAYQQTFSKLAQRAGVTGYRRVIHPELAKTGTCGLCIAASDQVYHVADLMPIHNNCNCTVAPIIGSQDPGSGLNQLGLAASHEQALKTLYAMAGGSTHGHDLKRVVVNQHGEYGPVLGIQGQRFLGPFDVAA